MERNAWPVVGVIVVTCALCVLSFHAGREMAPPQFPDRIGLMPDMTPDPAVAPDPARPMPMPAFYRTTSYTVDGELHVVSEPTGRPMRQFTIHSKKYHITILCEEDGPPSP